MEQPDSASEHRGGESRVESTASFMSMERAAGAVEANGLYAPGSPSRLSAELARRLAVADSNPPQPQAALALSVAGSSGLPPPHEFTFFCEPRHDEAPPAAAAEQQGGAAAGGGSQAGALAASSGAAGTGEGLVSKWRQKERLKTTAVALVMCLNIGVDPPDVIKISPCARLECWVDPLSMQAPKALDTIGKNLQAQYERWQPRAKYKMHLDPTTEDVKKLAISCRRTAKGERVLFHYNGHGVPRPTANGEVWVFNKSYTQYIPLSIYDLQTWVGTPAIYVFDCSAAGQILYSFRQFMFQRQQEMEGGYLQHQAAAAAAAGSSVLPAQLAGGYDSQPDPMRDCILLCACGESELLPQNPDLPADVFTSCLTTPIKVALRWFCSRSLLRHEGITKELIDRIPGKQTDRKTPLGELNWVFTAITDTIAWNVLPRALFQKLFRQDLLVASLFRNFLLAERIMRAANCTPVSYPRLPPTHQHPMWQAWDMAAEMCLLQLPDLLSGDGTKEYQPSPFFSEQLTAFELWLEHGGPDKKPPEQLPIVLQVLLSQVHRLRALVLLGRFLDMGAWAVDLALSVGIFPYVLKLLQTTATDLRQTLVLIWAKIMAWDTNSQVQSDLVKDGGHLYFVKHLESRDPGVSPESRAQAAFVLAAICDRHPRGQLLCAQSGLLQVCLSQLPAALAALASAADAEYSGSGQAGGGSAKSMALLVRWLLLCMGKLSENAPEVTAMALREQVCWIAHFLCKGWAKQVCIQGSA
jgi:regulator-associated protein of mTOR